MYQYYEVTQFLEWSLLHGINTTYDLFQAVKADLDLPLSKMEGRDERQVDAASSFSLTGFKESELTINNTMFTSSSREELSVPPPMEHRAFSVSG